MGANRAFARKLSAPKLLKWEIASDRFQAKCNNTKANTSERTRSESCKMTSIIHVNWKQRRCRVFLQIAIEVTLVELCTDRVKLQGVCVCVCEGLCACVIFIMLASKSMSIHATKRTQSGRRNEFAPTCLWRGRRFADITDIDSRILNYPLTKANHIGNLLRRCRLLFHTQSLLC